MKKRFFRKKRKLAYIGIFLLVLLFSVAFFLRKSSSESNPTQGESQAGASSAANIGAGGTGGTGSSGGGSSSSTTAVKPNPLTQEEIGIITNALLSSEFLKALPEKYPVKISFFEFQYGVRVWRGAFLFNNKGLLSSGEPEVSITLHSKYIPELKTGNLCDVIQKAKKAGDLGFSSESSTVSLFLKYAGVLKYRSCFGF